MKKIILLTLILVSSHLLKAQTFPYLNASTGNKNEFIVDVDSNIFVFHNSRIEKLDKSFNPIWVNDYSSLSFKNLLLSKTGSLFFIATSSTSFSDIVGKINANGSLNWAKTAPSYTVIESGITQLFSQTKVDQMLLDRNNNLILTGVNGSTMYFLKVDTLGNLIKLRSLTNNDIIGSYSSKIINDISGIYMVSSWGYGFEGPVNGLIYKYSDLTDLITNDSLFSIGYMGNAGQVSISDVQIIKSKNQSNAFYLTSYISAYNNLLSNTFSLRKFKNVTVEWGIQFQTSSPYLMSVLNIEEDHFKNTYVSFSSDNINTNHCEAWVLKVDSNGICDNTRYNLIQYYRTMASRDTIVQLMHHYGNNYFCSIEPTSSVLDPLTIIKMDSTIGIYCTPSVSIIVTPYTLPPNGTATTLTSITSATMTTMSSTVTSVLNYSVIINSCLPLGTKEFELNHSISIYPNPTINKLNINHSENFSIIESSIFDITGKLIAFNNHQTIIDVSKLNPGIYFIKVITDKGEFRQKFIKE